MFAKRIIPCLDIKDGRVVKGVSFVNLRDAGDPVECAAEYDRQVIIPFDVLRTSQGTVQASREGNGKPHSVGSVCFQMFLEQLFFLTQGRASHMLLWMVP